MLLPVREVNAGTDQVGWAMALKEVDVVTEESRMPLPAEVSRLGPLLDKWRRVNWLGGRVDLATRNSAQDRQGHRTPDTHAAMHEQTMDHQFHRELVTQAINLSGFSAWGAQTVTKEARGQDKVSRRGHFLPR
jgi:hypothetical protein